MSWWRRLFRWWNKTRSPAVIEVSPGLEVTVTTHTIPHGNQQIPCWTYVTSGLARFGQQEMILSLRRREGDRPDFFPHDPLAYFKGIQEFAKRGEHFRAGNFSLFHNEAGFLGNCGPSGFLFLPPASLPGVKLPPAGEALLLVLLTADEAQVVPTFGTYRVLTRLAQATGMYPCPPWSDRDRPSVVTPADFEQSFLAPLPLLPLPGSSVTHTSGAPVLWRVPLRLQPLLGQVAQSPPPGEAGFAFLTDPDPGVPALLVWQPGQQGIGRVPANASADSPISGGFLALKFSPEARDRGIICEDGFAFTLAESSWQSLRDALAAGQPFNLACGVAGELGLRLQWC